MSDDSKTNYSYDPFAADGRDRWGRADDGKAEAPDIPNYQVIDLLGSGGMGAVWSAKFVPLNQPRAIKVLSRALAIDMTFLERFAQEAKALARLDHPNIVKVYDASADYKCPYIAMDFVGGKTLGEILKTRSVSQDDAMTYFRQIAEALDYAHSMGFVHRDIKPSNIMIANSGKAMLIDFGVASWLGGDAGEGQTLTGTTRYLSPEACKGGMVTKSSDLWAFGVLIYRTLTGGLPFDGKSEREIINSITSSAPKEPKHSNPRVRTFLTSVLDKDPKKRPKTAGEMVDMLQHAIKPFGIKANGEKIAVGASFLMIGAVCLTVIGGIVAYFVTMKPAPKVRSKAPVAVLDTSSDDSPAPIRPGKAGAAGGAGGGAVAAAALTDLRGVWFADFGNQWAEVRLAPSADRKFHAVIAARDASGVQTFEADGEVDAKNVLTYKEVTSSQGGVLGSFAGQLSEDHGRIVGKRTVANGPSADGQWVRASDLPMSNHEDAQAHYSVPIPVGWQMVPGQGTSFSPIGRPDVVLSISASPANGAQTVQDVFLPREQELSGANMRGGSYQNLGVNPNAPFGGRQAVSWEFRHQAQGGPLRHAVIYGVLRGDSSLVVECWWPTTEEDVWPSIFERMRKKFSFTE